MREPPDPRSSLTGCVVDVFAADGEHIGRQLRASRGAIPARGLQDELVEVITHLAFYSEWPKAMSAAALLRDVVKSE